MHVIDLAEQIESNQIYKRLVLSLLESDNLDEILWKITEDAIGKLGFEDCVVYILEGEDTLVQKAAHGPKNPQGRTIMTPITIPLGQGIVGTVAKTGISERITDTRLDPRYIVDDEVRLSELAVPIVFNGKVIGVLDSESSEVDYYSEAHLQQFLTIAQLAAPQIFYALTREHLGQLNKTLQESSTRYKQFVEHCPQAIVVHKDERIVYHNEAFTSLLLHKYGESLNGRELGKFLSEEQYEALLKSFTHMTDSASWCEIDITTNYFTRVTVEATSLRIPLQGGEAIQTILHDITEYKRKEKALTEATVLAESANRTKSQFLSRMSHELRTPLNAIIGFAQLQQIKFPDLPEDVQHGNQEILSAGQHLLALVNDILDISRIEQKQFKTRLIKCDLHTAIESSISLVRSEAEANNVSITTTNFDYNVSADPTRLKQVIVNLLNNAVKYNKPDGKVHIQASRKEPGVIELRITDTGIGIPPDQIIDIFEPFNRLKQAEQHHFEGAGIGLSLAKALLQEMNGTIKVESREGEGSTFSITLKSADENALSARPSEASTKPNIFSQLALSVLYVEDDRPSTELVKRVFEMFPKVSLQTTGTAQAGIKLAKEKDFDLIMLDINLPDMSGIDAMHQIRAQGHTCKITALSADAQPEQIDEAMAAGFDFYLTKPLQISELSSYLRLVNAEKLAQ